MIKTKPPLLAASVTAAIVALIQPPLSQAQVLEEVMVTAQKKSASVNDVPVTMTALGGTDIKDLRLTDAMDVAAFTTNIDIKGTLGGTNPAITIRGVGLNDFNANNNPSVGVYVDEVFLVSAGMLNFSTFDMERIEVLKGPQGTLYGRNTNAGALNYFTTRPDFDPSGYVNVTAGNYGLFEAEGAYGNAINDQWAYRISGKASDRSDSYVDNELGGDFDGSDMQAGRFALRYVGDKLNFDTSLSVGSQSAGFQPFKNRGFIDSNDPFLVSPCPTAASGDPVQDFSCASVLLGVDQTFLNVDLETFPNQKFDEATYADNIDQPATETDSLLWVGRFDYDLSDTETLTSITSYAQVDREYADSVFGSLKGYHYFDATREDDIEQFSQEIRYALMNETVEWTAGAFYSYDEVESSNLTNASDTLATLYAIDADQETTAMAVFSQLEYTISEVWSVDVGLRYSYEERDFVGGTTDLNPWNQSVILYLPPEDGGFGLPPEFTGPLPLTAGNEIDFDDDDVSGRLGVNIRPNDDWLIYASISNGFKSGIVFTDITFVPEEMGPLDPEEIISYELGFKATLAQGSLQLNGAVFYYDYSDIQTQVPTDLGLTFTNAKEADITGLEVDVHWMPIEGLSLRAGASFLDTELNDPALDGNELPNAPETQYNIIARYDMQVADGMNLAFQGDMKYSDEMYKEATNNPLGRSDDYTLVNGRISLGSADGTWDLSVWGKNLTDEEYLEQSFIVDFFGITGDLYNTPRTYGATLAYNF